MNTPTPPPAPPQQQLPNERLHWLFRDVLRRGLVHPLIHLVLQYRKEQTA